MVLVVLGIDALDPELVNTERHPNLTLESHHAIDTIESAQGEPSTHELWPSIITGLRPTEHGLVLEDGVAWENPLLALGSAAADFLLPDTLQSRIGALLLTKTRADAFRVPATYYTDNNLSTVFDGRRAATIGIPNYVVDPDNEDREHSLRRNLGSLFERDPEAKGGHKSADPASFYEQCLEMSMIRVARARRGLRGNKYELVFAYTSGLDLIGHVTHQHPELQQRAYNELDDFVGELRNDLGDGDELILVSDHGLQEGVHTNEAMVAATDEDLISQIELVTDVRGAIDDELNGGRHVPDEDVSFGTEGSSRVQQQLEDLGYM